MSRESTTHLTWSTEMKSGICPICGERTLLVIADSNWKVDEEAYEDGVRVEHETGYEEISDEVTGHWCPECNQLRALSLNTLGGS